MASSLALKYRLRILFHQFNQLVTKEIRQSSQGPQVVLWKEIDGKEDEFEFEIGNFLTCEALAGFCR